MDEITPEFIWMVWSSIINLALSFQANEKLEIKSDFSNPYDYSNLLSRYVRVLSLFVLGFIFDGA